MSVTLELADLAAEQWGLLTTAQAGSLGVSAQTLARLNREGVLERITHGVYRVGGTPVSPLDDLRAAWLTLDPRRTVRERIGDRRDSPAVVSYRSAARLHDLGDLEAPDLEFTVSGRKQSRRPDIRLHRAQLVPDDWTVVDGLPVTTVIRTIADLATSRTDGGHLGAAVRDALVRHGVDRHRLVEVLRPHAHRYGAQLGDAAALVSTFIQEAPVVVPLGRAIELSSAHPGTPRVAEPDPWRAVQNIIDRVASLERAVEPVFRINEQIDTSPVLISENQIAEMAAAPVGSHQIQLSIGNANPAVLRALADLAESLQPASRATEPDEEVGP